MAGVGVSMLLLFKRDFLDSLRKERSFVVFLADVFDSLFRYFSFRVKFGFGFVLTALFILACYFEAFFDSDYGLSRFLLVFWVFYPLVAFPAYVGFLAFLLYIIFFSFYAFLVRFFVGLFV